MRKLFTLLAGTFVAVIGLAGTASAAPFINVSLEASEVGQNNWTNTLTVVNGQTYDYRVTFTMAPVGTTNTNPAGTTNDTILSYNPSSPASTSNGLNNIKLSLAQSAGDSIQVDFNTPTLDGSFDEPPGASTGVVTA